MKHYSMLLIFLVLAGMMAARAEDYKWHKTAVLTGNGIMQGPLMDIRGSKLKVRYSSGDNSPILIELYSGDGTQKMELIKSSNRQSLSGVKVFMPKDGFEKGYLRVRGTYRGWKVEFEQFVDDVRGWELTRLEKQRPDMDKIAAWSGEQNRQEEIPLSLNEARNRVIIRGLSGGRLKTEILNSRGELVSLSYMLRQGIYETWIHGAGEYKLRMIPEEMQWTMEVDAIKSGSVGM